MNGNPQNAEVNAYKRKIYRQNKYDLIEIYPYDFKKDWERQIDKGIDETLEGSKW